MDRNYVDEGYGIEDMDLGQCYFPNSNPYPLCVGNGSDYCKKCSLYEDFIGDNPPEI